MTRLAILTLLILSFATIETCSQEDDGVDLLSDRETLTLLRKVAENEIGDDGPEGEPEPPVISFWQTGMTGGDRDFPNEEEEEKKPKTNPGENSNGNNWKGQIVGRIGVRGLAPIEWNSNTAHQSVLSEMMVEIANIEKTQLEFEEKSSSTKRHLLALRHTTLFQQFSLSYTINARTDQGEADMMDIVDVLKEKIPTREFASDFTKRVLKIEPGSPVKDVASGGLSFVVSAEAIEAPMVRTESNADNDRSRWGYSGLNEWSTRESGVVRMGTHISTSISLLIEGEHATAMSEQEALFKAATVMSLKQSLGIDLKSHVQLSLKMLGNKDMADWGGSGQVSPKIIRCDLDVGDVPSSFDESKLQGAMTSIIRSGALVKSLCDLAGGYWCEGASIQLNNLSLDVQIEDLRSPKSNRINGVSGVLYPYFNE